MTKTGSTKNKILNFLTTGNKTLSDISAELGLAPSTVSQHLQELRAMGAIKEIENEHIRKWKYYELNPEFNYQGSPIGTGITPDRIPVKRLMFYAVGIGIIAAVAYALFFSNSGTVSTFGTNSTSVPITLTDPPNVPAGTNSLVITYSAVSAHVVGNMAAKDGLMNDSGSNSVSGWIQSNTSGTVDLMSLLNVTEVIAKMNVPQNSIINMVRFNITSATITINGTKYNVTVPSGEVTAHIVGNNKVNSSSGVLVDLSPTVVALYTDNSTVFVMVPAVKAIVVPNESSVKVSSNVGDKRKLRGDEITDLDNVHANISISNPSLSTSNDTVGMKVTVINMGTTNVTLTNLLIVGNQTPVILYNGTCGVLSPNQNPVPLWCRLTEESVVQIHGKHHPISGELLNINGDGSMSTNITANALNLTNMTETSAMAMHINESSVHGSDHMGFNSSMNASGQFQGMFGEGDQGQFDFGVGSNGIGMKSAMSNVDIRAADSEEANAILQSGGNITITNAALMHLMSPSPIGEDNNLQTNASFYRIIPNIAYPRGLYFGIEQNGTLMLQDKPYAYPLESKPMFGALGFTLKPGQSETFTFNGQIVLPGDFKISLVNGAKYRIEITGDYGAHAITNVTAS